MKSKRKIILYILIIVAIIFISIYVYHFNTTKISSTKYTDNINAYNELRTISENNFTNREFVYLSDIPYITDKSFAVSGHSIHLDENDNKGLITLKVNDKSMQFIKGICAWATSEIVYDLSNYDYDYFTSYLGVDISEQSTYFNTGAKFYIYTSNDGENWEQQLETGTFYGWSESQFVQIDIKDAKYLKLVADDNSDSWWANWYDETVFANAKLIKEGYEEDSTLVDFIKTVDEYDEIIKSYSFEQIINEHELTLLQREFVNNVGYDILQALAKYSDEYKDTILWLMNDKETLRLYLVGGKPEGSYLNSIKVLSELYTTYKDDLTNENKTEYGTTLGDLYRTMMLSLSLTESGNVYLWIDGVSHSDASTRYEIYKKLHLHEGQEQELIENKIFESLTVEEMRWVMNTIIDDEEIEWLNDFVRNDKNGATGPYSYIKYTFGYNYGLDKYYDPENYDTWDEKYHLSKYNITYQQGQPKLWIVFEEGAVCGGLSKTGSCIWGAYKGLPNTCVSQPGHCAYIYYSQDANGNGIWGLGNDVFGWGQSGRTEHLNVRTMNDWGNGSYTTGWNASYILLAQAAQNEYQKYEKAEEILMLENVYKNDTKKLEEIYREALKTEEINFDAWLGLVNLYLNDTNKTEEDYYNLAEEIATNLTYYPRPMYDLITLLESKFESPEYTVKFTLLRTKTLTTAKKSTNTDTIQVTAVQQVANALLGLNDPNIATFSFDGENAGAIILSNKYEGVDVQWEYSFDGGKTWTDTGEHKHQLTSEELADITEKDDIKIHVVGVDYSEDNVFTIDIQKAATPTELYNNDLENTVIGINTTMEWRMFENDEWTSYQIDTPDLTGNKTIQVRIGNTGTNLASDFVTLSYTEDNQPDTQKYIPIAHLSIHQVSSEQTENNGHAIHAIDGNINTIWHTAYDGSDSNRTIIIKLDEPVYLSALQYVPRQSGSNGRTKNAILYVSIDGENWTQVCSASNWENNASSKMLKLDESVNAQYVKFVTTENWGDGRNFASASMINLFEDITKNKPNEDKPLDPDDMPDINDEKIYLESASYKIDNTYVYRVGTNTTLTEFKNNLKTNDTATIKVYKCNKEGTEVEIEDDEIIGTGMRIVNTLNEQKISLTISVIGDIDGNGIITATDLSEINHEFLEPNLKGELYLSADIEENNNITATDLSEAIRLFFKK